MRYNPNLNCVVQGVSMESLPTKGPSAEASGDRSSTLEKTVMETTGSPKRAAGHDINGSRIQKKSPKGLKRPKTAEDVNILDASKEGNVGRFINVRGQEH